jgi:Raf kinase inhibitor-like YbhB/YbcL family protein
MASTWASSRARTLRTAGLTIAALTLPVAASDHGAGAARAAPAGGPFTISSPAFADGAPVPVQFTCKGANIPPPLTWSAPLGGVIIVDDPDAPSGLYVHWIVVGIAFGSGSTAAGQTPAGAVTLPNSAGQTAYAGPCPPAGSGVHHYRFTLYQTPNNWEMPAGLSGVQAEQTIATVANAQTQFTGTFGS